MYLAASREHELKQYGLKERGIDLAISIFVDAAQNTRRAGDPVDYAQVSGVVDTLEIFIQVTDRTCGVLGSVSKGKAVAQDPSLLQRTVQVIVNYKFDAGA